MLVHHSANSYETQKGIMADHLREKFERTIKTGAQQAQSVIEQLDAEVPRDRIIPSRAAKFVPVANGVELMVEGETQSLHDHAFNQVATRCGLHRAYASMLRDEASGTNGAWAAELLAHNLNERYHKGFETGRYLARSVDNEVRGWLSDKYRRLDCRPLVMSFYENAVIKRGCVPVRGYGLPTKVAIRVVLPIVFEPIPNEPMLYGAEWYNSDFGDGAHSFRIFVHRPWCTNEATRDDVLRQVHHGKRLHSDFRYSQRTYELDQKASVAALSDVVEHAFLPENVDETFALIAKSASEEIDESKARRLLPKSLTKGESEKVVELFNSTDDANMPEGKTRWRLSNAISFLANNTENQYRALDLERIAGRIGGLATARE